MDRTLRLVFFTAHYHPHRGGIEKYVDRLARTLTDYGCESMVITSTISSNTPYEVVNTIPVYRIPTVDLIGGEYPVPYPSRGLRRAIRAIESFEPDFIVTNTRYFLTSCLGMRIARRRGIRTIHLDHGSDLASTPNPLFSRIARLVDRMVGRFVIRNADYCAGVSGDVNAFLARTFGRECDAIFPNAVDVEEPLAQPRSQGVVYGFAGRLIEEKGVLLAIEAFEAVKEQVPDAVFRIAGTGPLVDRIRKDPSVEYVGLLTPEQMPGFYASIDVFLLPTWYREGFATAVLEAGMHEKLVITTDRGSARDLIPDDSYGRIIPQRDVAALTEAMLAYATPHPKIARKLRARVLERFTWDTTAQRFSEAIGSWYAQSS